MQNTPNKDKGCVEILNFVQYCVKYNLVTQYEIMDHINGSLRSMYYPYKEKYEKEIVRLGAEHMKALDMYRADIASGKVVDPDSIKTRSEILVEKARGMDENSHVQAARRLLAKNMIKC